MKKGGTRAKGMGSLFFGPRHAHTSRIITSKVGASFDVDGIMASFLQMQQIWEDWDKKHLILLKGQRKWGAAS